MTKESTAATSRTRAHRYAGLAGAALLATVSVAACGTDDNGGAELDAGGGPAGTIAGERCATGTLNASGSTAQANAIARWTKAYQQACPGARINYGGGGSGQGVTQFIQGSTDFAGSDSALTPAEHRRADDRCGTGEAVDLPMVVGPIGVVYNLPGVDDLKLAPKTIAGIFAGTITKWNDPRIAGQNRGARLPDAGIQTVHRADASGTSDNFTHFLRSTAPAVWKWPHDKQWRAPGGTGAKGSDGVAAQIKQQRYSIGYDEFSYVRSGDLQSARVRNGSGAYVQLTADSASAGVASARVVGEGEDLSLAIDYKPDNADAYPIVLTTYEIVCTEGLPAAETRLVRSFLSYAASDRAQSALTELGYAPLPAKIRHQVRSVLRDLR